MDPDRLLATPGGKLWVANFSSEDISVLSPSGEKTRLAPDPKTPILGGHTEKLSPFVMGGKRTHALAYSKTLGTVFAANLGPNIGPNPERMEVTMNGGITVIDNQAKTPQIKWHVSLKQGYATSLALDDKNAVLYATDRATGRLVAFDAKRLVSAPKKSQKSGDRHPPYAVGQTHPLDSTS